MKTTFILLTIYLISVFVAWKYMKISHSKHGKWSYLNTGIRELLITLTPILNSYFIIIWIFAPPRKYKKNTNFNKFFNVKKD
jgi:hypothetical protein